MAYKTRVLKPVGHLKHGVWGLQTISSWYADELERYYKNMYSVIVYKRPKFCWAGVNHIHLIFLKSF